MEVGASPVLGNIDDLVEFGQTLRLDDIIVALPWTDEARIGRIIAASRVLAANIHLGPDLAGHTFAGRPHARRGGLFVITIAAKPLQGWLSICKLIEDKLVALAGLVLLAPVLLQCDRGKAGEFPARSCFGRNASVSITLCSTSINFAPCITSSATSMLWNWRTATTRG